MEWAMAGEPDYVFPSHVYYTDVDGQMVLLNLENEEYFGLDEVGSNIVTRLTEQSWDRALTDLVDYYEVDPEVLRRDVDDLVGKLLTAGLLKRSKPTD